MYLVVNELISTLDQSIHIKNVNQDYKYCLKMIKLWLLFYNYPTNDLKIEIFDENDSLLLSQTYTMAYLLAHSKSALQTQYCHGFIKFTFDSVLFLSSDKVYKIRLSEIGTHDSSKYVGWVMPYEDKIVTDDNTGLDERNNPMYIELYTYNDRKLERKS